MTTTNSKWIAVESLAEPVTRVARRALKARLRWLWSRLPLAAEAKEDVEHIHQLRVASRRAHAAMKTFAPYLPSRRAAWFDRQLKRIRRAAGEARDLDVIAMRFRKEFADRSAAAAAIVDRIAAARKAAQPAIIEVYRGLQPKRFRRRIHKLLRRVRMRRTTADDCCGEAGCGAASTSDGSATASSAGTGLGTTASGVAAHQAATAGASDTSHDQAAHDTGLCDGECCLGREPSIAEAARHEIRHLVDAWFTAADADLSDTGRLHRFRIAGKELRYAMEIFAAALGSNCRKALYPQVIEILEHLGHINDRVASEGRLQAWLNETECPEERALLGRLLASDAEAITNGLHAFFALWTPERRDALRRQFADELADATGR
ncbi:MAG TPA: CHAD domain-containing protein [Pirellulales bacterium]|nr:CHAD domain-containing protein [Pirellulales bacterium]